MLTQEQIDALEAVVDTMQQQTKLMSDIDGARTYFINKQIRVAREAIRQLRKAAQCER